jgi:hypothetical protein
MMRTWDDRMQQDDQLLIWVCLFALTSPYWLGPVIIRRILVERAPPL